MTTTAPFPPSMVFLLGCQRSGTTWLANIFDASPDVLLFMEPFSPPYGLFPEFPPAAEAVALPAPALTALLRDDMPARLMAAKSWMSPASLHDPAAFRRLHRMSKMLRRLPVPALRRRIRVFELLNLNRLDDGAAIYRKSTAPPVSVIKELRFAFKVDLLRDAFPQARFVVIARHPCATVHSILSWFGRGRLVELKADLETYLDDLSAHPIGQRYAALIERCRGGSLAHRVALYWRVSYEAMAAATAGAEGPGLLVYERLASRPLETARDVFERSGIPWSPTVEEYVADSSRGGGEPTGPTDTRRDSARYFRQWEQRIDAGVRRAVDEVTADSSLMTMFEPFYNGPVG